LFDASRRQRFKRFDTLPSRTVCRYFLEGLKWTSWFSVSVIGSNESPQSEARISSDPHLHLWWDQRGMQLPVGPHSSPLEQAPPSALLQVLVSPRKQFQKLTFSSNIVCTLDAFLSLFRIFTSHRQHYFNPFTFHYFKGQKHKCGEDL
jgi:hypothetical protein